MNTNKTPVDQTLIDRFKRAGFRHKGFFMNNGTDYGEDHSFEHRKLGCKLQVKGSYAAQDWVWSYGLGKGDGKFIWCGCDFKSWEHSARVMFACLGGQRTPGVDALDDPLRSWNARKDLDPFLVYTTGMILSGGEDWSQHRFEPEDFPEGFHFRFDRRKHLLPKILAGLSNSQAVKNPQEVTC